MQCSKCNKRTCSSMEHDKSPKDCPTVDDIKVFQEARKELGNPDVLKTSQNAAHVEVTGYMKWSRLQEIIVFAKRMRFKRLGVAFCVGLQAEAKVLTEILEFNDFEVFTGICTIGSLQKKEMNIPDEDTFTTAEEVGCNPIGQAFYLNAKKTELNIVVGLCIGHDINFIRYSEAPTTVFIVKDRVTGHNPVATLYSRYYKRKFLSEKIKIE